MKRTSIDDPVVRAYMCDLDRCLLRENLKLSPAERLDKLVRFSSFTSELQSRRGGTPREKASPPTAVSAEFEKLRPALVEGGVEFILIGGVAAIVHGSARITYDVDAVYHRSSTNLKRLASTLKPLSPYLRGAPPGLPFAWDERTIRHGPTECAA